MVDQLVEQTQKMAHSGYRLVQICCTKLPDSFEINYSFDKGFGFENFRIILSSLDRPIPSVSGIYWNAFLYENEMHDLYGITITGIAVDYKGNFYRTSVKTPFNTKEEGV